MLGLGRLAAGMTRGRRASGASAVAWRARGHIVSRAFAPVANTPTANGSARTLLYEQNRFYPAVDANNLSLVYHNIRVDADGYQPFQIKAAAFTGIGTAQEYYQASMPGYEVALWSGGTESGRLSPSIAAGDYRESSQMALDVTAGQLLIVRNHATWGTAPTNWPKAYSTKYVGDEVKEIQASFTERIDAPIDWAGGYYAIDTNAYAWMLPSLVLGDMTSRKARVAVLHDSFGDGSGDSDAGGAKFAGWPQKLLADAYPWYFFGQGGWSLYALLNTSGNLTRFTEIIDLGGFTHVLLQLCTNDLDAGRTSAQFMADVATLKAAIDALPLKPRLILTTPPPRTNAGNSAVTADYAQRQALDAAIRAANGAGYGYVDQATLFAGGSVGVSGLWDTTGGKGQDGTGVHPNKTSHEAVVTANSGNLATLLSIAHYA